MLTSIKHEHAKPKWLKVRPPSGICYVELKELLSKLKLTTVCEEALCPNLGECWSNGTATFMLMGDMCTRNCHFCAIKTGNPKGVLDSEEINKIGLAVLEMKLKYVVLTSVDRDDLKDFGANHFASTIKMAKFKSPKLIIEVLVPDFQGSKELIQIVLSANPDVFAHNLETVERLTSQVRDGRASYLKSLHVLKIAKELNPKVRTKTSLMLGLGEEANEIIECLKQLRQIDCDVVTFGQYLQPTYNHFKVRRYISPDEFCDWKNRAEDMGFLYVASGPLVRSSYRASELFSNGG